MTGQVCPIFERSSDEEITLIGVWLQHPTNLAIIPDNIHFTEIKHLAPVVSRYLQQESCRQVSNDWTDVGHGCQFNGGAFLMGIQYPAPNEQGGLSDADWNYVMKQNEGVIILIREQLEHATGSKKWWQFWKTDVSTNANSEKQLQGTDVDIVKQLLSQSLSASQFIKQATKNRFKVIGKAVTGGTEMHGPNSRIIFTVVPSYGPDTIFTLSMKQGEEPVISLVDECKLLYELKS